MFVRRECDRPRRREFHAEHVLSVVGDAGRIAVAPGLVDLVDVGQEPVLEDDALAIGRGRQVAKEGWAPTFRAAAAARKVAKKAAE